MKADSFGDPGTSRCAPAERRRALVQDPWATLMSGALQRRDDSASVPEFFKRPAPNQSIDARRRSCHIFSAPA